MHLRVQVDLLHENIQCHKACDSIRQPDVRGHELCVFVMRISSCYIKPRWQVDINPSMLLVSYLGPIPDTVVDNLHIILCM